MVKENEQAREREITCHVKLSTALKRDTRVTLNVTGDFRARFACLFPSTIPEQKERLLVV